MSTLVLSQDAIKYLSSDESQQEGDLQKAIHDTIGDMQALQHSENSLLDQVKTN